MFYITLLGFNSHSPQYRISDLYCLRARKMPNATTDKPC